MSFEDTPRPGRPDASILNAEAPIEVERFQFPQVELGPIEKMRAIAAALPYCAVRETVLEAPFDRVWDLISDFERSTPRYEGTVRRVEVLERSAERLRIRSQMVVGFWMEAEVVLRSGWCLMDSRLGKVGMAARPDGIDRTRFIHFEGSSAAFGRLLRPYFHWNIGGDFRRLMALLE